MSDTKISNLTELTAPVAEDELVIVDKSDTTMAATGTTKKITKANLVPQITPASSSAPASLDLHEDTDNGTNKITVTAPSAVASNKTLTLPDATDTLVGKATADILTNKTLTSPVIQDWDGWQVADAMTFVSTTSFSVTGDKTSKYTKGTKIKLTNNSSVKYFYVVSSSFSTNTVVTITGGSDYSLVSGAITLPYYSYSCNPQGFPNSFNFIPNYENFTIGNASVSARFIMIGKMVQGRVDITLGSTSSISGSINIGLPIPALSLNGTSTTQTLGTSNIFDSSAGIVVVGFPRYVNKNFVRLTFFVVNGSNISPASCNATLPFTFDVSDEMHIEFIYEADPIGKVGT